MDNYSLPKTQQSSCILPCVTSLFGWTQSSAGVASRKAYDEGTNYSRKCTREGIVRLLWGPGDLEETSLSLSSHVRYTWIPQTAKTVGLHMAKHPIGRLYLPGICKGICIATSLPDAIMCDFPKSNSFIYLNTPYIIFQHETQLHYIYW